MSQETQSWNNYGEYLASRTDEFLGVLDRATLAADEDMQFGYDKNGDPQVLLELTDTISYIYAASPEGRRDQMVRAGFPPEYTRIVQWDGLPVTVATLALSTLQQNKKYDLIRSLAAGFKTILQDK